MECLFTAYHSDLSNIADRTLLTNLATEAGLDRAELAELWGADAFADAVRAEHARASEVGATAVPAYRIGERTACGALSTDDLLTLLRERWWSRQAEAG